MCGRRGCSNTSSPAPRETRNCAPRSTRSRRRSARISTERLPVGKRRRTRLMTSLAAASSCRRGRTGYSDVEIRTALLCMVVGGPPQPPMVVPQAMEQLLRRPDALADAHKAAVAGNDARLHDIVIEAMRFDPLAPGLPRIALNDWTVARGTRRATTIPKGATVLAAFASAMMDERRLPNRAASSPAACLTNTFISDTACTNASAATSTTRPCTAC